MFVDVLLIIGKYLIYNSNDNLMIMLTIYFLRKCHICSSNGTEDIALRLKTTWIFLTVSYSIVIETTFIFLNDLLLCIN
jgi:hypothetical protein